MSTHVVPKGTIAEQRDDRPAAVLRAGVLAAIALLSRGLTAGACIAD